MHAQQLQTPVSLIGGTKIALRLWYSDSNWIKALCPFAVLGMWAISLSFYVLLTAFPVMWIVWGFYTMQRRHNIRADRRARGLPGDPGELTERVVSPGGAFPASKPRSAEAISRLSVFAQVTVLISPVGSWTYQVRPLGRDKQGPDLGGHLSASKIIGGFRLRAFHFPGVVRDWYRRADHVGPLRQRPGPHPPDLRMGRHPQTSRGVGPRADRLELVAHLFGGVDVSEQRQRAARPMTNKPWVMPPAGGERSPPAPLAPGRSVPWLFAPPPPGCHGHGRIRAITCL